MAKTKISEFSATPANNTDIDSINIAEGCAPSGINDAIRELMAQLKDFQTGAVGDSFNGPIGTSTAAAGAFTTLSATGAITSTLATGTAPLVIASTTKVANLNVDLLDGADWAAPAALGSTTPAAVSATTLSASSTVTLSGGTANGVAYLNGSKVVTSGSALTFDGTGFQLSTSTGGNFYLNSTTTGTSNQIVSLLNNGNGYGNLNYKAFDHIWSYGATEQMRLTSTGLGIGTSSPSSKLQLTGASQAATSLTMLYSAIQAGSIGINSSGSMVFGLDGSTGTTTRLNLDTSGNLGLGVTPSAWTAGGKNIEVGSAGNIIQGQASQLAVIQNATFNSGWKYSANGLASFYNQTAGTHVWYNAPSGTAGNAITFTQAMSLLSSGAWVLGDTSVVASGFAGVKFNGASFNGLGLNDSSATSGAGYVYFQSNGTTIGSITRVASTSAVAYNTTSDQRLKNDLGIVTSTDVIADTVIHDFTWKSDGSKARGVFAQEAAKTLPSAVKVGDNGEEVTDQWQVDYSKYIPDIIVELQALRARVAELEAK